MGFEVVAGWDVGLSEADLAGWSGWLSGCLAGWSSCFFWLGKLCLGRLACDALKEVSFMASFLFACLGEETPAPPPHQTNPRMG